jgi:outer membrane receptor protein involved in Fe transport
VRFSLVAILVISVSASARAQQTTQPPATDAPPPPQFSEAVEVVAVTPVHGLEVPKTKVAANVQIFTPPRVPALAPPDASRLLAERAVSVHTTDAQAGTFQPDVLFRGFTGSPLLGSSEGLAVYQDGVRMNEAFGDTVNWDALPSNAIASLNLIPGSNPLFGLNALGGALSIRTKDGFTSPGARGSARAGSFGRYDVDAESGGRRGAFGYYLAGSLTSEDGWRDHSPSTVRKLFGDAGWRGTDSQVNVSFTGASNDLTGNGPAPVELPDEDDDSVFTYPDKTDTDIAEIPVAEGSSLPGVPRHSGKFGLAARLTSGLDAGFTVRAQSGQYLRGDEANFLVQVPGFVTADAHGRYRFNERLSVVGRVTNLFNGRYYTFGVLGDATLIEDDLEHARFYSPGAPRGAWVGAEVRF